MKLLADNYKETLSSCYFLDLRNSTYITREISLSGDRKSRHNTRRLKKHAIFLMKINEHVKKDHLNNLKTWSKEIGHDLNLGFGIGLHTGGSLVYNNEKVGRNFVFGIVLNTASRVESYTKQFTELSLLFTHNFISILKSKLIISP